MADRALESNEPLVSSSWPNLTKVPEHLDDILARYRLLVAAVDAEKNRAADGTYPRDGSKLALGADPFAAGPLKYKASDDARGYKVWSVWHDGTDEGGTPPAAGAKGDDAEKGDLVLERK